MIVIPSDAVRSGAQHRGAEESVLENRTAIPLMSLRLHVGCLGKGGRLGCAHAVFYRLGPTMVCWWKIRPVA